MSGRSAYVRKEKKEKKNSHGAFSPEPALERDPSLGEFPLPAGHQLHYPVEQNYGYNNGYSPEASTITSNKSIRSVEQQNARPVILYTSNRNESLIEKSSLRSIVDKKSEGFRKGLNKAFGGKKKQQSDGTRPETAATVRPDSHELEATPVYRPTVSRHQTQFEGHGMISPPSRPPTTQLPALPSHRGDQLRIWPGNGISEVTYGDIPPGKRDLNLWLEEGDVEIYLCSEAQASEGIMPSYRVSSEMIKHGGSEYLIKELHRGVAFNNPPSPPNSADFRYQRSPQCGYLRSPASNGNFHPRRVDSLNYRLYLPAKEGTTWEQERERATTRNAFAVLRGEGGLVGYDFYDTLDLLQKRLGDWLMPQDPADMIIDYLCNTGLDDVSNSAHRAAAILAWSETGSVRWEAGYKEAFVHAVPLFPEIAPMIGKRMMQGPIKYPLMPITKGIIENQYLLMTHRVISASMTLQNFDFISMWRRDVSMSGESGTAAKHAFDRLREVVIKHYQAVWKSWPPPPDKHGQWLTRPLAQRLQEDFAAVYDMFVDREVCWDYSVDRAGRKGNLVRPGHKFDPDTVDFPFTDMLEDFDSDNHCPHIPHPYPLVPAENSNRDPNKPHRHAPVNGISPHERVNALTAYTNATNLYALGEAVADNDFLETFREFEKNDIDGYGDAYNARRGRWVLIYGVLQTLAGLVVDTPGMKYDNVTYFLNPELKSVPPWKGANAVATFPSASHTMSYCWTIRRTWAPEQRAPILSRRNHNLTLAPLTEHGQYPSSYAETSISDSRSDAGSSVRSPTLTNMSLRSAPGSRRSGRNTNPPTPRDFDLQNMNTSYSGYSAGIEKMDERDWPAHEPVPQRRSARGEDAKSMPTSREPSRNGKRENSRRREDSRQRGYNQPIQSPMGDFDTKDFKDYDDALYADPRDPAGAAF